MSNYPPGCVTYRGETGEARFMCVNPDCPEHGVVYETGTYWELGGTFLEDEEITTCPHCDWYRADLDVTYGLDLVCVRRDHYKLVDVSFPDEPAIIGAGVHAAMEAVRNLTIDHRRRRAA